MTHDLEIQAPGRTSNSMEAIYLSESFVVVQLQPGAEDQPPVDLRRGFEIVDRRSNREVYLDGAWAELFARQIEDWRERSAPRDEVEAMLEGYTQLSQAKLALH